MGSFWKHFPAIVGVSILVALILGPWWVVSSINQRTDRNLEHIDHLKKRVDEARKEAEQAKAELKKVKIVLDERTKWFELLRKRDPSLPELPK